MTTEAQAQAQAKAREYFRTKATELPSSVIHERVAEVLRAFEEFVLPLSAAQAARTSIHGEWTIQEIVDHVLETYRPGLDELWCLLAGRRPPGEPIPASLRSKAPLQRPWPWILDEITRTHAVVLRTLGGVRADFTTAARAPIVMVVNVTDARGGTTPFHWIEDLDWKAYAIVSWRLHAIDHLKQAKRVLAAMDR